MEPEIGSGSLDAVAGSLIHGEVLEVVVAQTSTETEDRQIGATYIHVLYTKLGEGLSLGGVLAEAMLVGVV